MCIYIFINCEYLSFVELFVILCKSDGATKLRDPQFKKIYNYKYYNVTMERVLLFTYEYIGLVFIDKHLSLYYR